MLESVYAKNWMAKHIRDLFRMRQDDLRATTWTCVVHNGKVSVKKLFMKDLKDREVFWCSLRPGRLPSWLRINWAVRKNWKMLRPIAMEGLSKSCTDSDRTSVQEPHFGT